MKNILTYKIFEAFESTKLKKVLTFINDDCKENFLNILSGVCKSIDFPFSELSDDMFQQMSAPNAKKLVNEDKSIKWIKFWFDRYGDLIFTSVTGVGDIPQREYTDTIRERNECTILISREKNVKQKSNTKGNFWDFFTPFTLGYKAVDFAFILDYEKLKNYGVTRTDIKKERDKSKIDFVEIQKKEREYKLQRKYFELVKGDDMVPYFSRKSHYVEMSDEVKRNYFSLQLYYSWPSNTIISKLPSITFAQYFDLYTKNPEVCSLLILKTTAPKVENFYTIKGRALLWKLADGRIFMDHAFTNDKRDYETFQKYAKENNWLTHDTVGDNLWSLEVKLKRYTFKLYPYLDSFKYLDDQYGRLHTKEFEGALELTSMNGGYTIIGDCKTCGGIEERDCDDCDGRGYILIDSLDRYGDWIETEEECRECGGSGGIKCPDCSSNRR